jgi:hypothetical protein
MSDKVLDAIRARETAKRQPTKPKRKKAKKKTET